MLNSSQWSYPNLLYLYFWYFWSSTIHGIAILWPSSEFEGFSLNYAVCSRFKSNPSPLLQIFIVILLLLEHVVYCPEHVSCSGNPRLLCSGSGFNSFIRIFDWWWFISHQMYLHTFNQEILQECVALCYVSLPFPVAWLMYLRHKTCIWEYIILTWESSNISDLRRYGKGTIIAYAWYCIYERCFRAGFNFISYDLVKFVYLMVQGFQIIGKNLT